MNHLVLVLGVTFAATVSTPNVAASPPDASEDVFGLDPVEYGSTYASNCYCLLCTKYCTVNGVTFKSGECCG